MIRALLFITLFLSAAGDALASEKPRLVIGSKNFTESYVLAEIIAQVAEKTGEAQVVRKFGTGGTAIVYQAVKTGEIDIYPEYTGTISIALMKETAPLTIEEIRRRLEPNQLIISQSIGFNNTYGLALKKEHAERLGIQTMSDLKKFAPQLRAVFDHEFKKRPDGYLAMIRAYEYQFGKVAAMEHSLGYEAISNGKTDIIEVYTTDSKIGKLGLTVLEDDRKFFPSYHSVLLARKQVLEKFPKTWEALRQLEGEISEQQMIQLNAQADLEKKSFQSIASHFLSETKTEHETTPERSKIQWAQIWKLTKEHSFLVVISILLATLLGIPLGVIGAKRKQAGQFFLLFSGIVQTIPSLALLCFLIPFFWDWYDAVADRIVSLRTPSHRSGNLLRPDSN